MLNKKIKRVASLPMFALLLASSAGLIAACGGGDATTASTSGQPPSSGSVTIAWAAPAFNADGTALTDVSGYRVYYGTSPSALTQSVFVAGSDASSAVISGLASGTYFFAVATVNAAGIASDLSNPASRAVP